MTCVGVLRPLEPRRLTKSPRVEALPVRIDAAGQSQRLRLLLSARSAFAATQTLTGKQNPLIRSKMTDFVEKLLIE
jgi:hypothetical protein